jgi:hypothetical protein
VHWWCAATSPAQRCSDSSPDIPAQEPNDFTAPHAEFWSRQIKASAPKTAKLPRLSMGFALSFTMISIGAGGQLICRNGVQMDGYSLTGVSPTPSPLLRVCADSWRLHTDPARPLLF